MLLVADRFDVFRSKSVAMEGNCFIPYGPSLAGWLRISCGFTAERGGRSSS